MSKSIVYSIRIPHDIKNKLPEIAERYHFLSAQELVRAVLGLIVDGQVKLTLHQKGGSDNETN